MGIFSLLTLNCFGAPNIRTGARLRTLAHRLNQADYTAVCLQEVQTHNYRRLLTSACCSVYPAQAHQQFVHAPKGGLLTLARVPFEDSQFFLFEKRGLWYTPALADWVLHKGVLATTFHSDGVPVVLMNTHLTANYTGNWSRDNVFARQEYHELMQIAELVNQQAADRLVILCGDFNIPRGSWLYEAFLAASGMVDPLAGDPRPTFRPHVGMGQKFRVAIDYILYRAPAGLDVQAEADLRFEDQVDIGGRKAYLSDHMAVETRFRFGGD